MSTFPGDVGEAEALLGIGDAGGAGDDGDDDDAVSFGMSSEGKQSSAAGGEAKANDDDDAFVEFGLDKRAGKVYRKRERKDDEVELTPEDCPIEELGCASCEFVDVLLSLSS